MKHLSEPVVIQLLKESITEIGMTIENARIECSAKPITHAFIRFKNDDERNKLHQDSWLRTTTNVSAEAQSTGKTLSLS